MKKMVVCLTCLVALMAAAMAVVIAPSFAQGSQNAAKTIALSSINITSNASGSALRVGFETVKPESNLDRFGAKPTYDIEAYSQNTLLYNTSNATPVQSMFNVSQRSGVPPTIIYNTGQTKPMYSAGTSSQQPVYNIAGYSPIKMGTPIP
ncbi:MAG: hypothetical protein ACE14P_05680 [Methanotrichaceae archaeon]